MKRGIEFIAGCPQRLQKRSDSKPEVLFGSVPGELLGGPEEVNFPGGFFGAGFPLIVQIDDYQVGGKSPIRVLAIVVDLHSGDVFWLSGDPRQYGPVRDGAGDDFDNGNPCSGIFDERKAVFELKRADLFPAARGQS